MKFIVFYSNNCPYCKNLLTVIQNENLRTNNTQRNVNMENILLNVYKDDAETILKAFNKEIDSIRTSIGKAKIDNVTLPSASTMFQFISTL